IPNHSCHIQNACDSQYALSIPPRRISGITFYVSPVLRQSPALKKERNTEEQSNRGMPEKKLNRRTRVAGGYSGEEPVQFSTEV
ncbi:hypothetical protein, partial [Anaeromusa sp.]|uniref:hypothetical protein n=1 Tax=Anaeromusa sp. TaxID=1872520 RepID=UPI002634B955